MSWYMLSFWIPFKTPKSIPYTSNSSMDPFFLVFIFYLTKEQLIIYKHYELHLHVCMLSHIWLFAIQWTVACQAPLSMGRKTQVEQTGKVLGKLGNVGALAVKKMLYLRSWREWKELYFGSECCQELTWLKGALLWVRMLRQEVQENCITCLGEPFLKPGKLEVTSVTSFLPPYQFVALHKHLFYYWDQVWEYGVNT